MDNITSSDINVPIARPTYMYLPGVPGGPNMRNINLDATGTSVRSPKSDAFSRRTNAVTGFFMTSISPTKTLEASAPWGIFFIKLASNWKGNFLIILMIETQHLIGEHMWINRTRVLLNSLLPP